MNSPSRIVIIGGGVIGLSVAWRLGRAGFGASTTVLERDRAGAGASRVAAGMIAPVAEAGFDDPESVEFGRASRARYPSFVEELSADAGTPVAFDGSGSLVVAIHRDDVEAMRRTFRYRESVNLPVEWLSGSEAREKEPTLTPRVSAAMWIPDDGQVDTRALLPALARACAKHGVAVRESCPVSRVLVEGDTVRGVECGHERIEADMVIVAAGAWSGGLPGIPDDVFPPVRPVKGQILRLRRTDDFALAHMVRGPWAYLLPKADGTVVVGATQEEAGFDTRPTAGGLKNILEYAWEMVPSIYDLPLESIEVGLRPGTRDHRPVIGTTRVRGLVMATGHFRHGISLSPATADAVCEGVTTGRFPASVAAFSPARFAQR
jgi:glycine oxidase